MKKLISHFRQILAKVPSKAALFTTSEWSAKSEPNKWSKQEILGHLCDSALYNWQRFTLASLSDEPYIIQAYPQDDLVKNNHYQVQPVGQILGLWQSLNQQILQVIQSLELRHYSKTIILLDKSEQTLQWLIEDYVSHLEHHLKQLFPDWAVTFMAFSTSSKWQFQVEESLEKLWSHPDGKKFLTLFEHGSMSVEIYEPKKIDKQTPHQKDELYVIISGTGIFVNDGQRHSFASGDVLFVPAGIEHRFEDFSDDFKTWVIFYGRDGGEKQYLHFKTKRKGLSYDISTDDSRLDIPMIYNFLSTSYWAHNRTIEQVKMSTKYSLNYGIYFNQQQIGFARVITDYATFGYLADVFVVEQHRGKGLAKWLCECIFNQSNLHFTGGWKLGTRDAHDLYKQFGFEALKQPTWMMERKNSIEQK